MSQLKQICILDANSVINLCHTDLGREKVIEWLTKDFEIYISQQVFEEVKRNLKRDEDASDLFMRNYREGRIGVKDVFKECNNVIKTEGKKFYGKIHEGERECVSLALYLSRTYSKNVCLISDDFDAEEAIENIFKNQQIGMTYSSFDILVYLYTRHSEISYSFIEIAIRDLTSLFSKEEPKSKEIASVAERKMCECAKSLKTICRFVCKNQRCYSI